MRFFGGNAHQGFYFGAGQRAPMAGQVIVFLHDANGLVDGALGTFHRQACIVEVRAHLQNVFQHSYVFIEGSEERYQLAGDMNGSLPPVRRVWWFSKWLADEHPPIILRRKLGEELLST